MRPLSLWTQDASPLVAGCTISVAAVQMVHMTGHSGWIVFERIPGPSDFVRYGKLASGGIICAMPDRNTTLMRIYVAVARKHAPAVG